MNWNQMNFDEGACIMLELASEFLVAYFKHLPDEADMLIKQFLAKSPHINEDYIHHQQAWSIAVKAHYCCALGGELGIAIFWEVENGYLNPPKEVSKRVIQRYLLGGK